MLGTYEKTYKQKEASFDVELYKRQMLGVLEKFDKFCDKHKLRYSVGFGTMIGAIRHRGFIPWDDDIDVIMPRPDYDKFIELTQHEIIEGCEVHSMYHMKNCTLYFAKVIDANTTLIETIMTRHMISGSYIDVFPVGGMDDDDRSADKRIKRFRKHYWVSQSLLYSPLREGLHPKLLIKLILYKLLGRTSGKELYKADRFAKEIPFGSTQSVIPYGFDFKYRSAFSPTLFDDLIEVPFENIKVKCFAKYDAYLTHLYGDYMKLPPKEYQVSHHYHLFIDLHRRWTRDELKEKSII